MARQQNLADWRLRRGVIGAAVAALLFTLALATHSIIYFSTTGPTIQEEIAANFMGYAIYAVLRLAGWTFFFAFLMGLGGLLVYAALVARWRSPGWIEGFLAGGFGICVGFFFQFSYVLIHEPSTILASWSFAPWRLVQLWHYVHYPAMLDVIKVVLLAAVAIAIVRVSLIYVHARRGAALLSLMAMTVFTVALMGWAHWDPEARVVEASQDADPQRPNIIMIGNDTMRADRVGLVNDYPRDLTPFIDELAARGTYFSEAYVPQGRTAPSMTSVLTGTWPATHGITSNFVRDDQKALDQPALPKELHELGYRSVAIGDWASSDIGKIDFGFQKTKVSPDQWNFKYLLRQGPRELRLFVSLFTGNEMGRVLTPEIYYLAGRPLTSAKAREARRELTRLAQQPDPFLMMLFVATSHGPFGSEYPYYTKFSGEDHAGSAKFGMTRVGTPEEIAERQAEGAASFDVEQIIDLYDATVVHFDDEVRRMVEHLEALGIDDNTIIVVFSDHGTDLFERDTWGQGNIVSVEDFSSHIPLLIVDPRKPGGHIVSDLVRAVDISPTLSELVGRPLHERYEGVSLAPFLEGLTLDRELAAYIETGELISTISGMREDQKTAPPILELLRIPNLDTGTIAITEEGVEKIEAARQRAIRTNDWMSIRVPLIDGEEYQLYATSDRQGVQDRAADHPDVVDCFRPTLNGRDDLGERLQALSACLDGVNADSIQ